MVELAGNLHIHTRYSDGHGLHADVADAAIAAGLDFVMVTDHNVWVQGVEGYYTSDEGRVLLMTGEEVHNVRRQPQASHFLAYGAGKELAAYAADPQELIDQTRTAGGYGFLAHPHEKSLDLIDSPELGWHDWEIEGFSGLEIWNYMSSVKNRVADAVDSLRFRNMLSVALVALPIAFHPERYVIGPEPETLALWDTFLAQGMRLSAIGNSDAHATPSRLGPIKRVIYPYVDLFRAVNTHVLLANPLTGELVEDKRQILKSVGEGRGWVGYDLPHSTRGFSFTVQGVRRGTIGDEMSLGTGATLQVGTPARCRIRLVRHGEVVAEARAATNLTHTPLEPGAYRVECLIPFEGEERGWIYSNPIYLR